MARIGGSGQTTHVDDGGASAPIPYPVTRKASRGALVSMVDRCSKFTFLQRVAGKTSSAVGGAILACLRPVSALAHTLTADNGKAFAGHREVAAGLSAGFYFATPYHSWERGLNEHTNGLVRQYFPKATGLPILSAAFAGGGRVCCARVAARRLRQAAAAA